MIGEGHGMAGVWKSCCRGMVCGKWNSLHGSRTSDRCASEHSPSALSVRHGGGTLSHSTFWWCAPVHLSFVFPQDQSNPDMASVLTRPTIEGVRWIV